jgi:hypothetical protein
MTCRTPLLFKQTNQSSNQLARSNWLKDDSTIPGDDAREFDAKSVAMGGYFDDEFVIFGF